MGIEIKRWSNNEIIFAGEFESVRTALEEAVFKQVNLYRASLRGANLSRADLIGADLFGASLIGADLIGASLIGASLIGANLSDANLSDANLVGADLRGADLSDANLVGVSLRGADLSRADLSDANLSRIRTDLFDVLLRAPGEIDGLRQAIIDGKIDGSTYSGECACLVGTVARVRGCGVEELGELRPDSSRPAERWFLGLRPGDTPETSQIARITLGWVDEFCETGERAR